MKEKEKPQWWLYILECADASLYTGICTDPVRRVKEHNESPKGARYTRARRPVSLRLLTPAGDRASASRLEAKVKRLTRQEKNNLLKRLQHESELMGDCWVAE